MAGEPTFRRDLYAGTAEDYDRYRPLYPASLIEDLRARTGLGTGSRVLDLACGAGQVAFALASHVAEVVAVDQEAESVEFGRRKAERTCVGNIRWVAGAAESVDLHGTFNLVAVGNAFHRLDRDAVTTRVVPHLAPGRGAFALLWGATPWHGDQDWQRVFDATLARWQDEVGARDRIPAGWQEAIDRDPHERVLARAGLTYEGQFSFTVAHRWTVESLTGLVYSTSFLSRAALGDRVQEFAQDLRRRLLADQLGGVFAQKLTFAYDLARRPG